MECNGAINNFKTKSMLAHQAVSILCDVVSFNNAVISAVFMDCFMFCYLHVMKVFNMFQVYILYFKHVASCEVLLCQMVMSGCKACSHVKTL